jgi:hypothetical protein
MGRTFGCLIGRLSVSIPTFRVHDVRCYASTNDPSGDADSRRSKESVGLCLG